MSGELAPRPPRLMAVDLGRGLAVFLMILVHTLWMYADQATQSASWLGHVIHFIGKGTPAFLLCMGISMLTSQQQSALATLRKGLLILCFGYLMNGLKFLVPIALGIMPENFIQAYGWAHPLNASQWRYLLLTGDILQMAGLSLILLAAVRQYLHNKYTVLVVALAILAISRELSGYTPQIAGLDYLAKLFFSNSFHVYFPLFPWMSFILFGMFIGMLIRDNNWNYCTIFNRLPVPALACICIGGSLCYWRFDYHFGNFFHLGPGGVIYLLGINFALMWLIHKVTESGVNNRAVDFLNFCSQRVTSMYVIQWTLICWGMSVIGFQSLSLMQTLAIMPVIVVLTVLVQQSKDYLVNSLQQLSSQKTSLKH
ncbi:uncharacterized protein DUF1624 [Sinobacterium caligoides]|uniref:Uncharacterized protein DUF1624 n=1 Tax=Sinobacterium caligoides TaxID=933926 RepID=A0A3N2DKA5_9GAMM|nr:heparan-alpha-glucosaminide N-acetyltransferase domain-containing protein [Sinobacterium caligoides]ROS00241.1 uncharacterized protein DUF1624 [Sinobacterium caligoides]